MKKEQDDESNKLFGTEFYEMDWVFDNTAFKVKINHTGLFLQIL